MVFASAVVVPKHNISERRLRAASTSSCSLANRVASDLEVDQLLWEWSDDWLRTGRRLRRRIATFENQGFDVEYAKPFREAVRNLEEDMKGQSCPTVALRPFTPEEIDCMASMCGEPAKLDAE